MGPQHRDDNILAVVQMLSPGEVVSYGDVAAQAGYPGRARLVGTLLQTTSLDVPWWRVVTSSGRLVPGNEREHTLLLQAESVDVANGYVQLAPMGRFAR